VPYYQGVENPLTGGIPIRRKRPQGWADFVTWYLPEQEYGSAHGLSGYDGVIEFYARR
jgi:hypothetical protein